MRRIPTQIARRGAALRRQRRQRVSLAANLSPLPADPTKSSYPDSAPIDFDASSAVSGGDGAESSNEWTAEDEVFRHVKYGLVGGALREAEGAGGGQGA